MAVVFSCMDRVGGVMARIVARTDRIGALIARVFALDVRAVSPREFLANQDAA